MKLKKKININLVFSTFSKVALHHFQIWGVVNSSLVENFWPFVQNSERTNEVPTKKIKFLRKLD